jgi:hypothetical protein
MAKVELVRGEIAGPRGLTATPSHTSWSLQLLDSDHYEPTSKALEVF